MYSMTGYGRGEYSEDGIKFKIEIKSVNNRYCEIYVKLPRSIIALEDKIRKRIKERIFRGKLDVFVTMDLIEENYIEVTPNVILAREYYNAMLKIKEDLGLSESIKLSQIYNMPNILSIEAKEIDTERLWEHCKKSLDIALDNIINMRNIEGIEIKRDFETKLKVLEELAKEVEKVAPEVIENNILKLKNRIKEYVDDETLDIQRMTTEVVIMSDKLSIDEEITRIMSHISHFNAIMDLKEPIGRKLDFLLQEFNREVNTIGSKTNDIDILDSVVKMKSEIEKLREQVQNIE